MVYKNIQNFHNELWNKLNDIICEYYSCCETGTVNRDCVNITEAKLNPENYYYWIRYLYNKLDDKTSLIASSMFIFLNKTCFRGIYRVGPNGFNVPYGNYVNPQIINKTHLDQIHYLIKDVIFICQDFTQSLANIDKNANIYRSANHNLDLFYLDGKRSKL